MMSPEEVLKHYNIEISDRRGGNIWACCPFHDDENPSFNMNPESGLWNCFSGCGGGSLVDFVRRKEPCDFKTAERLLDTKFMAYTIKDVAHMVDSVLQQIQVCEERNRIGAPVKPYINSFVKGILTTASTLSVNAAGKLMQKWVPVIYEMLANELHTADDYIKAYRAFVIEARELTL
jgi:hypothetical protein